MVQYLRSVSIKPLAPATHQNQRSHFANHSYLWLDMKKDIPSPQVENLVMAVVLEEDNGQNVWNVFLINLDIVPITNVIVTSRGYGEINGEKRSTSTLRHFYEKIPDLEFTRVEPIMENTFGLTNEYWVSFYIDGQVYDKKYVFLPESISEKNFTQIPLLNVDGVMIR